MVLRWCFITYVRYVSATGRSYEDIFKDNEHKTCTIFASLLTLSHTFKQHGLYRTWLDRQWSAFFYQKFLVIIKSSVKVSYLFLQLVIFYPREALVKVGWWLWSSAEVVWYGRVLDCASPGFRRFRISVPKTSEYFTIEPIGSILKYSNVLGTYVFGGKLL